MRYLNKSKRVALIDIIRRRIASGEISKSFAFEIAWLEGLHDYAAELRDEILNPPTPIAAPEPPIPMGITATKSKAKRARSSSKGVVLHGDFRGLAALLEPVQAIAA